MLGLTERSHGVGHPLKTNHGNADSGMLNRIYPGIFFPESTFRVLYVLDRLFSASLGRPCAIQEEESVSSFESYLVLSHGFLVSTWIYQRIAMMNIGTTKIPLSASNSLRVSRRDSQPLYFLSS